MKITRFGTGHRTYDFEANGVYVTSYSDNFGDVVPRTQRLPGMDGGFDQYGGRRAPVEIGKVTLGLTLVAPTRASMDALRRDIRQIAGWGTQRLFRSVDYQNDEQWCYARINSAQLALNEGRHSDLFQPVQVVFQAPDPAWYAQGTEAWAWGDGTKWAEKEWGGAGIPIFASGLQTDITETVGGNFPTMPRIIVTPGLGRSCTNPTIQVLNGLAVVDEVRYTGTLAGLDTLKVDARAMAVTVNGVDAYADFDYRRGGWFELSPGDNAIRVTFANVGDRADVRLRYFTRFI
jgi:hypothetical protein